MRKEQQCKLRPTLLDRIVRAIRRSTQMRSIVTDRVAWPVGLSVTLVSPAK